jgi:hypothetical protein
MKRNSSEKAFRIAGKIVCLFLLGYVFPGCVGGGGITLAIFDINNSSTPASPTGLPIELNGIGFGAAPGSVSFMQGANVATVVPALAGWTTVSIVVVVPNGGSGGAFAVPGTVTVTVTITGGGTSNGVDLSLVSVPSFLPSSLAWGTTTALPAGMRGHGAVAIANIATSAYLVVVGGTTVPVSTPTNVTTVLSTTIAQDGTLGATWINSTSGVTQNAPLPSARSYHATVEADSSNSQVSAGAAYVYVIGGQALATDTPGGTSTVYRGTFSITNGNITSWMATTALPVALVAPAATVYNGYVYVVGGLVSGTPIASVYSAAINSDGTLSGWTTAPAPSNYPSAISFGQVFGFGGNLYVAGGGTLVVTDPNSNASSSPTPINDSNYAAVSNGAVGAWTPTSNIVKGRDKHVLWMAFGQVIIAEGLLSSGGGSSNEMETSTIAGDGTLGSWNGLTGSQAPNALVFNSAGIVSPIRPVSGGPRFLLIGGEPAAGGSPVATIWVNSAP